MTDYSFRLAPGYCLYNGVAVFNQEGAQITFLIENPRNEELQNRLRRAFTNHVEYVNKQSDCPVVYQKEVAIDYKRCSRVELKKTVSNIYKNSAENLNYVAEHAETYKTDKKNEETDESAAAVLLLDSILNEARAKEVTDIHIEQNLVRFRIKGKLQKQMELPEKRSLEVVQRIKLLGGMNVIENRKSQDGRFVFNPENPLFIRVSSVPVFCKTESGCCESIVLRLLDPNRISLDFRGLGFNDKQIERIEMLQETKDGLLIICGPTGSGKSTTAAALLKAINAASDEQKKIISLEDPPEFVISGVTQLKVDDNRDNSFEVLLNHIFRQDPDVIMIGEIRDEKSAAAALRAGLTGHLVIATLHTSSASGALLRLENLGLDRKLIASVLRGVIVQELETINQEMVLMADVCFPCSGFSDLCTSDKGQAAIEKLFDSEGNGGEVLAKSLEVMKAKRLSDEEKICGSDEELVLEEEVSLKKRRKHHLFSSDFMDSGEIRKEA